MPWLHYLGAGMSFVLTTALIVGLRPVAKSLGLVDVPNERKVHSGEIPLIGGIAIFCSVFIAHTVAFFNFDSLGSVEHYTSFYVAAGLLVAVGVVDDIRELSPAFRLVSEALAALILVFGASVTIQSIGSMGLNSDQVTLGVLTVPFTVFAIVGLINAINMSDGLDGLAGTLTLVPVLGFIAATTVMGNDQELLILACIAAGISAFLLFNVTVPGKRRALIFLGDSGSMFLGMALAWFAIRLSQGDGAPISPGAALWFFMLPIFDSVCMISRRILRRRAPFSADKEHLHHVFLLAGFTVTETILTMGALALLGVMVGLAGSYYEVSDLMLSGSFLILGMIYFWAILRAWTVMRFLRRSICRRREIGDRRTSPERRRRPSSDYLGPDRRIYDRRQGERRGG